MIEKIDHNNVVLAIIIRSTFSNPGIHFVTPNDYSQQLAYMRHPSGKIILPHIHCDYQRTINDTKEVLIIRRGRMRVDFYDNNKNKINICQVGSGDVILLVSGGHGFEVLEEIEMIEVKQGPYAGDKDKIRFAPNE
jgi:mannose-6-phosphate isomerase-like protein (cupin superfamily)